MRHICFLDDSLAELQTFEELFSGHFEVTTVLVDQPANALAAVSGKLRGRVPNLFLLDLYLPQSEDVPRELRAGAILEGCRQIGTIADAAAKLPSDFSDPLRLLKEAHDLVAESRRLLQIFCTELNQSAAAGVRVLLELQRLYSGVPKVCFSRKANLADLKSAIAAGATDVLLKPHWREQYQQAAELAERFEHYCAGEPAEWLQPR